MSKQMKLKAFQQESVNAIVEHFKKNNRALCADEAGLGKTLIANGVVNALANEKLNVDDYKIKLVNWWKMFASKAVDEKLKPSGGGTNYYKYCAVKEFIKAVTGNSWVKEKYQKYQDSLMQSGVLDSIEKIGNKAELIVFLQAVIKLYCFQQGKNVDRANEWKTPLELDSYKVLYVCCNLAIAEQNKSRLVQVPQRSVRSTTDKPDRLSVLWYYLEKYKTPYIEIYTITSTVSSEDTSGSKNEREKLAKLCLENLGDKLSDHLKSILENVKTEQRALEKIEKIEKIIKEQDQIKGELRMLAEQYSIRNYKPDLIIFDEFQNFADMINLIEMKDIDFKNYLEEISKNIDERAEEEEEEAQKKSVNTRIESLKRCRNICKGLINQNDDFCPKLLFLSATPFHRVEERNGYDINSLSLTDIVKFFGGNSVLEEYKVAEQNADTRRIEQILYGKCGIFRNERLRLMKKNNSIYHKIECDGLGLLSRAFAIHKKTGNRAAGIVMTTPELEDARSVYSGKYYIDSQVKCFPHSRYQRLKEIITALNSNNIGTYEEEWKMPKAKLTQLLWMPPIKPSNTLGDVFAEYSQFSKTLVFSNLKVTPVSVCNALNKEFSTKECKIDDIDKFIEWLKMKVFDECEESEELAKVFSQYIESVGGHALGEKTSYKKAILYCEEGCLREVIHEYIALGHKETDLKLLFDLNYSKKIAFCMTPIDLNKSDESANVRRNFNSPFYPFVLMTTSIGSEGLDFHVYCNRLAHYTMPSSVIELEQKNGRIDRFQSLAQRRNWSLSNTQLSKKEEQESGGMIPDWDAGVSNLHYYFFHTKYTSELDKLEELFSKQEEYRKHIGVNNVIESTSLNLCPFLKKMK